MRTTITINGLTTLIRKRCLPLYTMVTTFCCLTCFIFNITVYGQSSPADCRSGCTSNDVQIIGAYLSDAGGTRLTNYVCGSGVPVYLTLQLTTNTPRVGVSIYSVIKKVVNGTATDSIGFVSQCFGNALNTTGSIVTFSSAINWSPCGVPIALTATYTAWGTGNTNFCTSNKFQCGGTPSKCHAAQAGEITIIQVPQTQTASATHCSDQTGSYSSSFDLTALQSSIISNSSNYNFKFYNIATAPTSSADTAGNMIANPSSFQSTVATKTVYAYVCSKQFANSCSWQAVTLNINGKPAAAASGDLITCGHPTATLSGNGSETTGVNYLWSGAGSVTNSSLINASTTTGGVYTLLVTNSTTGCSASATASVSVNISAPTPGATGGTITCSNLTTTLNGTPASGVSYSWSGPGIVNGQATATPEVNAGGLYTLTVTSASNGCTASATASVTANKGAPVVNAAGDLITCSHGTATLSGTGSTTGGNITYLWTGSGSITDNTAITASTSTSGTYTLKVTDGGNGCTAAATASVSVNITAPTAVASGDLITCSHTTASLSGNGSSTGGNISYLWSGAGAVTNSSSISASTSTGGLYTLKVTNTTNGCSASATASVSVNTTAPTFTVCLVQPTLCDNTAGSVTVFATNGTSFTYKLNSGTPQSSNTFTGLGGGSVTSITVASQNGCSTTVSCANLQLNSSCGGAAFTQRSEINNLTVAPEGATVKAYPNPFNDKVKFVISSPTAGNGSLDIYNTMGQKVKTVYQGHINAGNNLFELTLSKKQQATLFYLFRVGDKKVTGKLLQLNN